MTMAYTFFFSLIIMHVVKPATSEVTGGLKLTSGKHIISSNH